MEESIERALIYMKEAIKSLTERTKAKFDALNDEISRINIEIEIMKIDIPKGANERLTVIEQKIEDLTQRLTDLENSRKREVQIFTEKIDELEKHLNHLKEANKKFSELINRQLEQEMEEMPEIEPEKREKKKKG